MPGYVSGGTTHRSGRSVRLHDSSHLLREVRPSRRPFGGTRRSSSKRQEQLVVSQKAAGSNPVCAACYLDHATGLMPARRIHGSMVDGYDGRFSTFKTGFESRSSYDDNLGEWLAGCSQSSINPVRMRELSPLHRGGLTEWQCAGLLSRGRAQRDEGSTPSSSSHTGVAQRNQSAGLRSRASEVRILPPVPSHRRRTGTATGLLSLG